MKLWRTPFDHAEKAKGPTRILIDKERCKGCAYCVEFCPKDVLQMSEELGPKGYTFAEAADESKCPGCGLCAIICPEFAIHIESDDTKATPEKQVQPASSRRVEETPRPHQTPRAGRPRG